MDTLIEYGIAERTFAGEHVSGDRALIKPFTDGVLVAAIDGLGHGEAAATPARIAASTLEHYAGDEAPVLIERCHRALKGTRGVAMSLASINARDGTMTWLGVGNVEGLLLHIFAHPPSRETLLTRSGVVGYQLPPLRLYRLYITAGDLVIFTTDGISSSYTSLLLAADPLLRHQPTQEIADRLLTRFAKTTDDALVLVIRYLGPAS